MTESRSAEWWNDRYLSGDIPWDTGIVPPEVVALVASGELAPGWALDLGCGSGLSSRYLAAHGFRVIGVDLAQSALARGRRAARAARLPAFFCRGDVGALDFLDVQATFALDIGCFHSFPAARRPGYRASLAAHVQTGGAYLLYAFYPQAATPDGADTVGVGPGDIAAFAPYFTLRWAQHGREGDRRSAWYLLIRTAF